MTNGHKISLKVQCRHCILVVANSQLIGFSGLLNQNERMPGAINLANYRLLLGELTGVGTTETSLVEGEGGFEQVNRSTT